MRREHQRNNQEPRLVTHPADLLFTLQRQNENSALNMLTRLDVPFRFLGSERNHLQERGVCSCRQTIWHSSDEVRIHA